MLDWLNWGFNFLFKISNASVAIYVGIIVFKMMNCRNFISTRDQNDLKCLYKRQRILKLALKGTAWSVIVYDKDLAIAYLEISWVYVK